MQHVLLPGCKHIITTQLKNWPSTYQVVSLETWSEDTALEFLKKITTTPWTAHGEQEYKDLVNVLGMHPLGIQHAKAFIKQTRITVKEYLDFLSEQPDVMAMEKVLDTGVKQSVLNSFLMTLDRIQKDNIDAFNLLHVLGLLDGTCIDERITKRVFDRKLDYVTAKYSLLDYSIIKCHQRTMELTNLQVKYISIHSLYQRAMIYVLHRESLTTRALNACVIVLPYQMDSGIWYNHFKHLWSQEGYRDTILASVNLQEIVEQIQVNDEKSYKQLAKEIIDSLLDPTRGKEGISYGWAEHYKFLMEEQTISSVQEIAAFYGEMFIGPLKEGLTNNFKKTKAIKLNLRLGNFHQILDTIGESTID